jgi:hypothetical protein
MYNLIGYDTDGVAYIIQTGTEAHCTSFMNSEAAVTAVFVTMSVEEV